MGEGHEFRAYECPRCGYTKMERRRSDRLNGQAGGKRAA